MSYQIGDKVSVLDEAISGVIRDIKGSIISIEDKDGFVLEFQDSELILDNESSLKSNVFAEHSLSDVVSEKEQAGRRKTPKIKPKERNLPALEVDLHIHQLTNSSRGMSNHDMLNLQLNTAERQLNFAINKRIQKVVFIHGVGEGVLKLELEYLFGRYNNVKFYDADYQKYGLGATEVYIYQNPD
ncbi:DNA mismatch repair protein MutS [Flavobacteriales bacterium 34_180_T64]|nr:DNA mismatch repair protein MutS [Flavobacteriales bacterium 34_180_T64]